MENLKIDSTNSYAVYEELIKTDSVDQCSARLILITLLAGAAKNEIHDESVLSQYIQKECCLKESVSDRLACVYLSLFSLENCKEWNHKIDEGFKKFCTKQWRFDLEAHGVWYSDNVHVDADVYASADIKVCDTNATHTELKTLLQNNPFTSEEAICSYFDKRIQKELSADFDEYVTCEDYYPPVAEDYVSNFECLIREFCKRNGFKLLSFECEGITSDYIPN